MRHSRLALAFAVASIPIFLATPARAELTIDAALAPTLPSELVAADGGRTLAWLEEASGVRTVWIAHAPEWSPRKLHEFSGDDGLELSGLAASSDGKWLAFVRGGDEGGSPETNAASDPAGSKATIWLVSTDGQGTARAVGEGGQPAFSPKGGSFAFVRDGQLWSAPVEPIATSGGKKSDATQLTHLRGRNSSPRFSPDGARLAFSSARDTHGFVGVLALDAKKIVWLDPGVDTDLLPTWSPDGKSVAFLRLPAENAPDAFLPRPSAKEPWSIRVADAATGAGRELFRAAVGDGSRFHSFETQERNLWWTADDRVVFPWEKSGWHHLHAIPAAGGSAYDLTPGPFEVEHAGLSPDGKTVFFTSNDLDPDGRTLWRIPAAGGQRIRLDQDDAALEFFPTPLAGDEVALLTTAAKQPVALALRDGKGGIRALRGGELPAGVSADDLVVPTNVSFPSTDGLPIHGQLFLPKGAKADAKIPAAIYVHGGPVRQMFAAPHFWSPYHRAYMLNQYFASHGVAVLSVNYRSGIGFGLHFREADGIGEAGASEFQDVLAGALYLKSRPEIDGARLGIWGGSYGGFLTAMALARASGTFKAGVDFNGVHDWNLEWSHPPFTRDYVATGKRLERAFEASPLADVSGWRSPVLLIHGDDDHNVPFEETVRLTEALRAQGVRLETLIFPDEVHGLLLHRSWKKAFAAAAEFLERELGAKR